jgi:hypothetical protein
MTADDIPGNIPIFMTGAFWADAGKLYVVGGCVNDEPWLARDGEFLPSNYSDFTAGTIYSYNIEAQEWRSETAVQPNSGPIVNDTFCRGSFAYNAQYRRAYYFSGNNAAGARKLDPATVPGYVGRTNEQVTWNGNLLTFDTANFKWYEIVSVDADIDTTANHVSHVRSNVTTDTQLTTTGTEEGQLVYLPGTVSIGECVGPRLKLSIGLKGINFWRYRRLLRWDAIQWKGCTFA